MIRLNPFRFLGEKKCSSICPQLPVPGYSEKTAMPMTADLSDESSGALNESVPSNICSWDDFLLAGKLFLCSYSPGK